MERETAKTREKIGRELERIGLAGRMRAVNKTVSESALFWKILKDRIAATETVTDIRNLDPVRQHAMAALAELGHDLRGVQLKLQWIPPRLMIVAAPTMEAATEVARAVRGEPAPRLVLPSPA